MLAVITSMKKKYIVFLILFCSFSSFRVLTNQAAIPQSTPKIIFLNYKIFRNTDGMVEIKLLNKIITEGKLKENLKKGFIPKEEDIQCIQMDSKSLSINSIYISSPLNKVVEFVNDSGQLEKKVIKLDNAEFSVRMQLNPKTKFITTYKRNNSNKQLTRHRL